MGMRGDWDGGWMQFVTRNSYTGTSYDGRLRFGGICGFFALGPFSLAHCAYRDERARSEKRDGIAVLAITSIAYG